MLPTLGVTDHRLTDDEASALSAFIVTSVLSSFSNAKPFFLSASGQRWKMTFPE